MRTALRAMLMRVAPMALFMSAQAGAQAAIAPTPQEVPAVWKDQKLQFHYFGRTSRYTCDGLAEKVRAMLLDIGARSDLRVIAQACIETSRNLSPSSLNPMLSIVFYVPAPLKTGGTSSNSVAGNAAGASIRARYQPFSFVQDAFRNFEFGDCELVEEFSRQILPLLAARAVKQNIACVPYQHSAGSFKLSGEVLKAMP